MSFAFVTIAGHLGGDPETRFTANGKKVTTFTVATNYRREGKDETIWWRVTVWDDDFEKMIPHLKKGSAILVFGKLSVNNWTDKTGQPRTTFEISAQHLEFNPFGRGGPQEGGEPYSDNQQRYSAPAPQNIKANSYHSESINGGSNFYQDAPSYGSGSSHDTKDDLPF